MVEFGGPLYREVARLLIGGQRHIGKKVARENRSQLLPAQRFCDGTCGADLNNSSHIMSGIEHFSGGNAGYQMIDKQRCQKAGDLLPAFLCLFRCPSAAMYDRVEPAGIFPAIFFSVWNLPERAICRIFIPIKIRLSSNGNSFIPQYSHARRPFMPNSGFHRR